MRELLPGIHTWGGSYPDAPWDLNGYAIVAGKGVTIIDPPLPAAADWAELDRLGPVQRVIVTNRSHTREAEQFRQRYGAPVLAGADEVFNLEPLRVDQRLRAGAELPGGIRVIHLPGKSPGEIGLHLEARRVLVLGDAILGHPPGQLGLIPDAKLDNPAQLRQSLRQLLALEFDVLLTCDGRPVLSGAKQRVAAFVAGL